MKNRDKERERRQRYYQEHKEEINKRNNEWYYTHKEERKEYQKAYYQEHKEDYDRRSKEWHSAHKEYQRGWYQERKGNGVNRYKLHLGCLNPDCEWKGTWEANMLEFHHLDPATKSFALAAKVSDPKRVAEEIAKCTLVCANCHRKIHSGTLDASTLPYCPPYADSSDTSKATVSPM